MQRPESAAAMEADGVMPETLTMMTETAVVAKAQTSTLTTA
jgi:hypothetical protein